MIVLKAQAFAARDLTTANGITILTSDAMPGSPAIHNVGAVIRIGSGEGGANDLHADARILSLWLLLDGVPASRFDFTPRLDTPEVQDVISIPPFPILAGQVATLKLFSSNANDTAVKVAADLGSHDLDYRSALQATSQGVWFVSKSGNDANDGRSWQTAKLTIGAAVAAVVGEDTIHVGPGTYALGAAVIELPDGVNLYGAGIGATIITSTAVLSILGCIVKPGTGSRISDLTIQGIAGAGVYQAALGYYKASAGPPTQTRFLHAWADRVCLISDADGVYIREEPDPGTRCDLVLRNCLIKTKYDAVVIILCNASVVLYDTCVVVVGPSSCAGGYSAHGLTEMGAAGSIIAMVRGSLEISGAITSNVGVQGSRGRTILCNTYLSTAGAAALDLVQADSGSIFVSDCVYDPAKTSGTITHVPPGAEILADTADMQPRVGAIETILAGITSLAAWLRGLFRKSAMDATAKTEVNTGGGTYNEATDSQEALRDTAPMGTPMRGTDGAALATVCTEARLARLDTTITSRASQLTALAIKAKTDTIGAADLTAVSPVLEDGDLEIVQGDDYMDADGRALEWTDTAYTGPIQDGDDAEFALMETADYHAAGGTAALTKAGTAHLVGTTLRIVVELTAAETAALEPSPPDDRMNYTYQVRVDVGSSGSGERQVTAALGSATVKKKVVA